MTQDDKNTGKETSQAQIEGLATLLVLDDEIKKLTNAREFGFFATNETHRLIPYHSAYLWEKKELLGIQLVSQSGTAELDRHAPNNQWLKVKIEQIISSPHARQIHQFHGDDPEFPNDTIATNWLENFPTYLLWCPFLNKQNQLNGGLVFLRETAFTEAEIRMLNWLVASYQYTWNILIKPRPLMNWRHLRKKPYLIALTLLALIMIFFPIRISVLAKGTVVAKNPVLVNAPLQGVIKAFNVTPGSSVHPGEVLVQMDDADLRASLEVDQRNYALTESKLRTAVNESFTQNDKRAEVPILQAQLAVDKARLEYTQSLLEKTTIKSSISGMVIFNSKEDWIGQPVQTGERILLVADPNSVKLRIDLPVSDVINLKIGADGDFYLYGQLSALPFKVTALGYNAKMLPNKILAYELEGEFVYQTDKPQIGAQGTVKLYGQHVPFIYYLLRRPLQAFRQTLGI